MPDAPAPHAGRPALALALYLAGVFVGGALLAPWLFHAVGALAAYFPALREIAEMPFGRYVNRALLIAALVGMPFFLRGAGIRSWADVGWDPRRPRWRRLGAGFALGLASLAAVCVVAIAAGARELDTSRTAGEWAARFAGAVGTALLVGVLEELLFRGAFFGGLARATGWRAALVLSSAIYAIVHFLGRPETPPVVAWDSGLRVLPSTLRAMGDPHAVLPGFLTLTLAGIILALAYRLTGDLWASIGIHAGWIFWLSFYAFATDAVPGADEWVWGTARLIDGWFAFGAIVAVLGVVGVAYARRAGPPPA